MPKMAATLIYGKTFKNHLPENELSDDSLCQGQTRAPHAGANARL